MNKIAVTTKTYTGPIDLLLSLVEDKKIEINQVSLADITEDYLRILKESNEYFLENIAEFIYIASVLVYIKSKKLLPFLSSSEECEVDAVLLESRINFQKYLKSIVKQNTIKNIFGIIPAKRVRQYPVKFTPPEHTNPLEQLHLSVQSALNCVPKQKKLSEVRVEKIIKLGDMIKTMETHLATAKEFSFSAVADISSKKNFIVSFLAVLELIRNGACTATQDNDGNIGIERIC